MPRPTVRLFGCLAVAAFVGGCAGGGCAGAALTPMDQGPAVYAPLPHSVPPVAGSAPFRFAMVHDVIHERYPRHGPAFYEERERLARERLAVLPADSEAAFALTDDIAVGLDRRGRTEEAIALMRDKLKRQQALGLTDKELYSSFANLGEFLVRGNLWRMLAGDETARRRVEEGRLYLRRSLTANPDAHFGREEWQLVAVDALLEAGADPSLLHQCDLIGNRLDRPIQVRNDLRAVYLFEGDGDEAVFGRPYYQNFTYLVHSNNRRQVDRDMISKVGGEKSASGLVTQMHGQRAPFDEPALWLIGEWRQGSGPSPHYALCLGEIMLRVGQRYLAWNCYERAGRMAEQFSPLAEEQRFLRRHCQSRQEAIEKSLPAKEVAERRPRFESELAFGEAYQRDYQTYEEQKIRAGADLNDEHFFDEFHAGRPPIASKVGPEEWYAGTRPRIEYKLQAFVSWGLLTGGALVLLAALWARSRVRPRLSVTEITPPSPAA